MTTDGLPPGAGGECHCCGAAYDAWSCLELLELFGADRIRSLLTSWDSRRRAEVRRCPRCGAALARLAVVPEPEPA
jgi:hypothetical protein